MKRIPTTQSLRALDSFRRHGTVWKAAEDLNLTRSAVSHQLRLLERDLDFALFTRVGTRLELTARGRAFAEDSARALSMISGSAARNAGQGLSGELTISSTPGFAASWLGPKLQRFRAICPEVTLSIRTPRVLGDVSDPSVDVFIAFADADLRGVEQVLLRRVGFTPLISPALLNRLGGMSRPEDVLRGTLLHLGGTQDWEDWLALAGVQQAPPLTTGIHLSDMTLVFVAALKGQGIALGDELTCREAMETGQLMRPFDLAIESSKAYYLAIPPSKSDIETVHAFRSWILEEVAEEGG